MDSIDVAFFAYSGESCAGSVARDYRGWVFVSVSQHVQMCTSVEEAEGQAILNGLKALSTVYKGPIIIYLVIG